MAITLSRQCWQLSGVPIYTKQNIVRLLLVAYLFKDSLHKLAVLCVNTLLEGTLNVGGEFVWTTDS